MDHLLTDIGVIVAAGALLAWLAALLRQPILLAYLLCGVVVGPSGLGWVREVEVLDTMSMLGITVLLFLAGMVLHPQRLVQLFRNTMGVTLGTSLVFLVASAAVLPLLGVPWKQALYAAAALMFSSTILVIKLLPTTTLHQKHMGSVCIAILIAQDILAIALLVFFTAPVDLPLWSLAVGLPVKTVLLVAGVLVLEALLLQRMMRLADRYHEVLYMLALGWCLGISVVAHAIGLSYEVGAFIAGVAIARSPVSGFLTGQLQPFRDFFLMLFFFVLGARFDLALLPDLWLPALGVSAVLFFLKPVAFRRLLLRFGEAPGLAHETGWRMGQCSEFGLILAVALAETGRMADTTVQLVKLVVILTLFASSYATILRFPTPLGVQKNLKQD